MSIKGTTNELYVGKTESNIVDRKHNKIKIEYDKLRHIEHMVYIGDNGGWLKFVPKDGEPILFEFPEASKIKILMTINLIKENNRELKILNVPSEKAETSKRIKSTMQIIWNETWGNLGTLPKIVFVGWSLFCLTGIAYVDFLELIAIWATGSVIFVAIAQVYHIKKRKEKEAKEQWLEKLRREQLLKQYYDSLWDLGKIFIPFMKNNYYVDVELKDVKEFDNGFEFIFSAKSKSQVEYIFSKKDEMVRNFDSVKGMEKMYDCMFKITTTKSNEKINSKIINSETMSYDSMEGHDFEYFCADILRKNNYKNVEVTQGSGDQGIDIIAYKDGVKYGIQCKCYSSDIGNKAVQEAFSGSKFYDCHVPVVLTNRFFTKSAKELAQKNNVLLWDRDYLDRLIESAEDA